jgi:hypothetical protein
MVTQGRGAEAVLSATTVIWVPRTSDSRPMPEPPFQKDMRSQGVPPRPTAHPASAVLAGSSALLLTVTRPEQLPDALRQYEKPVVIDRTPANSKLTQDFERLLRWQRWRDTNRLLLIGTLVVIVLAQMVMSNRYGLEASWYAKWTVFEIGGQIKLTPSQ